MSDSDPTDSERREPLTAAEKQMRIVQRKADAKAATQDYRAEEQATRDKTAKLRKERLEREKKAEPSPQKRAAGRRSKERN